MMFQQKCKNVDDSLILKNSQNEDGLQQVYSDNKIKHSGKINCYALND